MLVRRWKIAERVFSGEPLILMKDVRIGKNGKEDLDFPILIA